jgi:hypothetical protein
VFKFRRRPVVVLVTAVVTGVGVVGIVATSASGAGAAALAAITEVGTAPFLTSESGVFSTRTADFIIQDHYPSGLSRTEGGPLFGVQFSQTLAGGAFVGAIGISGDGVDQDDLVAAA